MRKKYFIWLILSLLLLTACGNSAGSASTVSDLAYNKAGSKNEVYIKENGTYTPYIVVTDDYNGSTLLLRKNVDYNCAFSKQGQECPSLYSGSQIDNYLETTVYDSYDESIRNIIVSSNLEIATSNTIEQHLTQTATINRNIFLLSMYEFGGDPENYAIKEGNELELFKDKESRIAYGLDELEHSYYTRSPALQGNSSVFSVSKDGAISIGGVTSIDGDKEGGVRPAFCIPSDTKVKSKSGIEPRKSVYVID